jgi:C-terminal processing protease CtpA/Prc
MKLTLLPIAALAASLLAACGGDGASPVTSVTPPPVTPPPVVVDPPPTKPPGTVLSLWFSCEHPRTGRDKNNLPYMDRQGSLADEQEWLRLLSDESYLWYKELPQLRQADYKDPLSYFADLKTPAKTASGQPKDRFHFTYPSDKWDEISTGIEYSYGITWVRTPAGQLPRVWRAAVVQAGSPADIAGVKRGDRLVAIDGFDFVNTSNSGELEVINAALSPTAAGQMHNMAFSRDGHTSRYSLQAALVNVDAVQNVRVLETASGKVGYLTFTNHNLVAEGQLVKAFKQFQAANVNDLVLDLRYNGGGLLQVASELAYMIAGPAQTGGKIFERAMPNDKTKPNDPIMFRSRAMGLAGPDKVPTNEALPYLGLRRVTVLSGPGTCSASESVINSLRGVDVEVTLVGGASCGKPYAFTPAANCGTTYFTIQLQGVNNKGWGDYGDGFTPDCQAGDDLSRPLGDASEGMLATALQLRAGASCPASPSAMRKQGAEAQPLVVERPQAAEIAIY